MHPNQLVGMLAVFALFVLPSAAICSRIIVGSIVKLRGAQVAPPPRDTARLEARMDTLEEEMRLLGDTVERMAVMMEFDAQLRSGAAATPTAQLPPA